MSAEPTTQGSVKRFFQFCNLLAHKKRAKRAFLNNHIARRKYIVAHAATVFDKNKYEPAPLLGLNLLYIGCRSSILAEELTFRGADVTIVEPNSSHITKAKNRADKNGANVEFIKGTPQDLIESDQKFDIILCMDAFEYEEKLMEFLHPTTQLLKEEGTLIFSCFNKTFSSYIWHILFAEILFRWVPRGTYSFGHFRSPRRMKAKLGKAGLEVVDLCGLSIDPAKQRWRRFSSPCIRYIGTAVVRKEA